MFLGKIINNSIELVECEQGKELNGEKTVEQLYALGYKKACLTDKNSDSDIESWVEYLTCIVQEWLPSYENIEEEQS